MKFAITALAAGLFASACLVDTEQPCGDRLVETESGACVCPEGTVSTEGRCSACGENEHAAGGQCVCNAGFGRSQSGASCAPSASPADCDPDSGQECPNESVVCESTADCAEPRLCDVYAGGQCVPPPEGLGQSCASDSDCAGTEATYCEVFSTLTCVVERCEEANGVCPGDLVCCDYEILSRSLCVPPDALSDGNCPAPGVRIARE